MDQLSLLALWAAAWPTITAIVAAASTLDAALPQQGDLAAQAAYYKRHYNTADGAATVAQYMANWQRAIT